MGVFLKELPQPPPHVEGVVVVAVVVPYISRDRLALAIGFNDFPAFQR